MTANDTLRVRTRPGYQFVPAALTGRLWSALRRAEGAEAMAWEAARLATAAALANAEAAADLRKVLAECGALPPGGAA